MRPQARSEALDYNTPELDSLILKTEIIIFWKKIKSWATMPIKPN